MTPAQLAKKSDDELVQILRDLRPQTEAIESVFDLRRSVWAELRGRGWTFAAIGEPSGVSYQLPARNCRQTSGK